MGSTCDDPNPPVGMAWAGAVIVITPEGKVGYAAVSVEVHSLQDHPDPGNSSPLVLLRFAASEAHDVGNGASLAVSTSTFVPLGRLRWPDTSSGFSTDYVYPYGAAEIYGPGCAEIGGWIAPSGEVIGTQWVFGARRVDD